MAASCFQYNSEYSNTIDSEISIDIGFVNQIIQKDADDYVGDEPTKTTGVWYPIVIKAANNEAQHCDLLHKSKEDIQSIDKYYQYIYGKEKCQSSDIGSFDILDIADDLSAQKSRFFDGEDVEYGYNALDCSYCGTHTQTWKLIDDLGNESKAYQADCCGGACDVRMNEDDYIPKIPLLNHHYYSEPCDFKYIKDNPARSGPGLGKEAAITASAVKGLTFDGDVELCIDWKLKETISEIEYDEDLTQHSSKNLHDKTYRKSKITSKTCGNFIFMSINQENKFDGYDYSWLEDARGIPTPGFFTKPYGIRGNTIENIFIGTDKIGSFWKWNYTSGILGWYRKYDTHRAYDNRPIPGVDLYISPGDVFYATNAAIEPYPLKQEDNAVVEDSFIKTCPSGLKIVQNSALKGIIPNDSSFLYISENIYSLFYEWYQRYLDAGVPNAMSLASIMATAPQFENVTTDLLDPVLTDEESYTLNSLKQNDDLSKDLQTGTDYTSDRISYVSNKNDLFDILNYKYGAYLGIKNNSTITFNSKVSDNFVLDMNFDFVTQSRNTSPYYSQTLESDGVIFLQADKSRLLVNGISYSQPKNYSLYDIYPRIVDSSTHDTENQKYCDDCDAYSSFYLTNDGEAACIKDGVQSFCYSSLSFFLNNSQGEEEGTRPLRNISDATIRESRNVNFYHPYIDTFAINSKKSMYVRSAMYDIPIGITSKKSKKCNKNSDLSLMFKTDSKSMIKLYWSTLQQVQNQECVTNERFPLDLNNLCQCYENNSYVPNVSTNISPVLKKYGGYSQSKLDTLFGKNIITAGDGNIPNVSAMEDPSGTPDCSSSVTISVPNYVYSEWDLEIVGGFIGNVSVNENIDTNISPWKLDTSLDYVKYNPQPQWKRFATKVTIEDKNNSKNSVSLYSKQSSRLPYADEYTLKLTNPFLSGLIGDKDYYEKKIAFPTGINCANYTDGLARLTDIRGDELSVVDITFTPKTQRKVLNFYFHKLEQPSNELFQAQFYPNAGLKREKTSFNPIVNNYFDYDKSLDDQIFTIAPDPAEDSKPAIFYDRINSNFVNTFRNLTDFKIDRSIKLYVKLSNNRWKAVHLNSDSGYFEHLGYKFSGKPRIFEYIKSEYETRKYPSVLPSVPKRHKFFDAKLHFADYQRADQAQSSPEYPALGYVALEVAGKKTARFEGSRYYFQVPPKIQLVTIFNADEDISSLGDITEQSVFKKITIRQDSEGNDLFDINPDTAGNSDFDLLKNTEYFIKLGGDYYKFIGPSKTSFVSYLKIDKSDIKLFLAYNDTQIDLQDISRAGGVVNSKQVCQHDVDMIHFKGLNDIERISNRIVRKYLNWDFYDENGTLTTKDNAYLSKLSTYFEFEFEIKDNLFGIDIHRLRKKESEEEEDEEDSLKNKSFSFFVYDYINSTDPNYLIYNSKWADVRDYDGIIFEEFFNPKADLIDSVLYAPSYTNWFYKHFVNSLLGYNKKETIYIQALNGFLSSVDTDIILGTVLQKYNLEYYRDTKIQVKDLQNHQNFIPIMDVTVGEALIPSLKTSLANNIIPSFLFSSSSLLYPYVSPDHIQPEDHFWIMVEDKDQVSEAYIPEDIYHPTLRVDGPFNRLHETKFTKTYKRAGYRKIFLPSVVTYKQPTNKGKIEQHDNAFMQFPIYGDIDKPKCEPQVNEDKRGFCILPENGTGFLTASHAYDIYNYGNMAGLHKQSYDSYFFSYDCGEYNPINAKQFVSIERSSLSDYTTYYMENFNNGLPNIYDTLYQDEIELLLSEQYAQDKHANEMLFRILYGEDQYVNREFFGDSPIQPLSKIDLIDYSDPEITARDLYDQILFNYDDDLGGFRDFVFDADIHIKEVYLWEDIKLNLYIDSKQLSMRMEDNEVVVEFQGQKYRRTLFSNNTINRSYISVEAGSPPPSPPDDNTTIEKVKTIKYMPATTIRPFGQRFRTGDVAVRGTNVYAHAMEIGCHDIDPAIIGNRVFEPWSNVSAPQVTEDGQPISRTPTGKRSYDLGNGKTQTVTYNMSRIPVNNLLGGGVGMQADLNLIPAPWRWSERLTSTESPSPPPDPELSYGYCRRQMDCDENGDDDKSIKENFVYEYEIGPYQFDLYGHVYLHTPLEKEGEENDCPPVTEVSTTFSADEDGNTIIKYQAIWDSSEAYDNGEPPMASAGTKDGNGSIVVVLPPDIAGAGGYVVVIDCNGNLLPEFVGCPDNCGANEEEVSPNICFNSVWDEGRRTCIDYVSYDNASAGNSPYGKFYYAMRQGPLNGINVRGDFRYCFEPLEDIDPNLGSIEPECAPFSDDTRWGLGYAIWKPLYGFYLPYGPKWAEGILHLKTMDPSTDEFWRFWEDNEVYREEYENPYHFSNSLCMDDATLAFFGSMTYFPVIYGYSYGTSIDTPSVRTAILENLKNYDYHIADWLLANGTTKSDAGLAMNYGDEGVDYCGYIENAVTMKDIDLYLRTTTEIKEYSPYSDIHINITEQGLTITIKDQTICIENRLSRCPEIIVESNGKEYTYTINDSGCNKCSNTPPKIKLSRSSSSLKTITQTLTHVIASIEGTDLNSVFHNIHFVGFVNRDYAKQGRGYYDPGDGWFDVVCGETPGNPWYSHQRIIDMDQMGVFDIKKNIWKQALENLFNTDNYADVQADSNTGRIGAIDLSSQIPDIARIRRTKRGNAHIKESDILHGVVPDSISEIKFREVNTNYDKYRRLPGRELQVETGQGTLTRLEAYVEYRYVRPYTLKEAIKESRLGVTDNTFVNQAFDLEFPLWYGSELGISVNSENALNSPPTKNFIFKDMIFRSDNKTCHSVECSYNTEYGSIFYGGAPCPENDHYCWSISSWNGVR